MKYEIIYSNNFKRGLKKLKKQGKNLKKLDNVVAMLSRGEKLESKYKDHALYDDKRYKGCRDCHIEPDWILVYQYFKKELILLLVSTGSHSDILDK